MSKLISHCIGELCYPDIEEHLKKSDIIIVPVGSTEQHSKHLPLCTDYIPPLRVTQYACELSDTLYTPILPFGYSPHHLGNVGMGTGTITLSPRTIMGVYYDIARSLIHHGYNKIIFVTGHASNTKIMDPVLRKLRYDTGCFCACYKPWVERYIGMLSDVVKGSEEDTPGWHAGETETSSMLYMNPELVRMDRAEKEKAHKPEWLPDSFYKTDGAPTVAFQGYEYFNISLEHREFTDTGTMGNPFDGSAETGKIMCERFGKYLADAIEEFRKIKVNIKNREFTGRADW